jgi:hypothetical protein
MCLPKIWHAGSALDLAGAVDQDVDLAEGLDGRRAELLQAGAIGYIGGEPESPSANGLDGRCGLVYRLHTTAGCNNVRAPLGQANRHRETDA